MNDILVASVFLMGVAGLAIGVIAAKRNWKIADFF
jgi:hypothetical protein